jgi:hypothetical protein
MPVLREMLRKSKRDFLRGEFKSGLGSTTGRDADDAKKCPPLHAPRPQEAASFPLKSAFGKERETVRYCNIVYGPQSAIRRRSRQMRVISSSAVLAYDRFPCGISRSQLLGHGSPCEHMPAICWRRLEIVRRVAPSGLERETRHRQSRVGADGDHCPSKVATLLLFSLRMASPPHGCLQ